MKYILVFSVLILTGCDVRFDRLMKGIFGVKHQEVVLVKDAFTIDKKPKIINSSIPLQVLGKDAQICLVLGSGYDLKQQAEMDELFNSATTDAGLTATYIDNSGKSYNFTELSQNWDLYGVIAESDEVAACFMCNCGDPTLPVGTSFSRIILRSDKPIKVLGAYWSSESEIPVPAKN